MMCVNDVDVKRSHFPRHMDFSMKFVYEIEL